MPRTATPTLLAACAAFGASFLAARWWRDRRPMDAATLARVARLTAVALGSVTMAGDRLRTQRREARSGARGRAGGRFAGSALQGDVGVPGSSRRALGAAAAPARGSAAATAAGPRPGGLRALWQLLRDTASSWSEDYAPSMGAALSYYTLFSIGPLLLIVVSVAGLVFGAEAAQGEIVGQLNGLVGEKGASAIEDLLASVQLSDKGPLGTSVGIVLLVIGATTVFAELQSALDRIWRSPRVEQTSGIWNLLRSRLLSFGLVLALGFLLMVSLVASAALAAFARWWSPMFGAWETVAHAANVLVSFVLLTTIFALIYKLMPRVDVAWRDVLLGSAVTALLFSIGKLAIGLYIGKSGVASGFGAASSIVVLLIWVYYSAQIFLLGAEFTWVYALRYGSRRGTKQVAAPIARQAGATDAAA